MQLLGYRLTDGALFHNSWSFGYVKGLSTRRLFLWKHTNLWMFAVRGVHNR
jgi:hypothetical protein